LIQEIDQKRTEEVEEDVSILMIHISFDEIKKEKGKEERNISTTQHIIFDIYRININELMLQ
jgi:hypothetical protein